jgi:hypothetical protein
MSGTFFPVVKYVLVVKWYPAFDMFDVIRFDNRSYDNPTNDAKNNVKALFTTTNLIAIIII